MYKEPSLISIVEAYWNAPTGTSMKSRQYLVDQLKKNMQTERYTLNAQSMSDRFLGNQGTQGTVLMAPSIGTDSGVIAAAASSSYSGSVAGSTGPPSFGKGGWTPIALYDGFTAADLTCDKHAGEKRKRPTSMRLHWKTQGLLEDTHRRLHLLARPYQRSRRTESVGLHSGPKLGKLRTLRQL